METDEVDNVLSQQMSCMVTNDKEALIREFQKIIGDYSVTPETCAFFLDMSNWNLQSALGAYYDIGISNNAHLLAEVNVSQLGLRLVKDVTIGEGESVPPNTRFVKTWRVRNTGNMHWPEGSSISFMEGHRMCLLDCVEVPPLAPNGELDVSVDMLSPNEPGIYQSRWQLNSPQKIPIGESIWCIIAVDTGGILDITQQLASAPLHDSSSHYSGFGEAAPHTYNSDINPFASDPRRGYHDSDMNDDMDSGNVTEANSPFELTAQLQRVFSSQPVSILRREGTEGPPCTPCTPPTHPDLHNWMNPDRQ
ncbi:unnamed protein product, partial [Mesorhabditis spiculigera]